MAKQFLSVKEVVGIMGHDVTCVTDLAYAYNSGKADGYAVTNKLEDIMLDTDSVLEYLASKEIKR